MTKSLKTLSLLVIPALCISASAFARDHASQYQVGTFLSTNRADDGSYSMAQCSGGGCSSTGYRASHNQHQIETDEGIYTLDAPVSVGGTILVGMLTPGGLSPTIHKGWFMDDLREGQQVLFYPVCNKRHVCRFWLPNPDKVGKEIFTTGWFAPAVATTNTATLCGTGKLSATVAAQVCGQSAAPPRAAAAAMKPISTMPAEGETAAQLNVANSVATPVPQQQDPTAPKTPAGPAAFLSSDSPEADALIKAGQASRVTILTVPPGAAVYIDGQEAGKSPAAIVLLKNGDTPRAIKMIKSGYAPVEKTVVPDGSKVQIEVYLQRNDFQ